MKKAIVLCICVVAVIGGAVMGDKTSLEMTSNTIIIIGSIIGIGSCLVIISEL